MKTYNVTIRAIITKTLEVDAHCEEDAIREAHERFDTKPDNDESYDEEMLDIEDVTQYRRKVA